MKSDDHSRHSRAATLDEQSEPHQNTDSTARPNGTSCITPRFHLPCLLAQPASEANSRQETPRAHHCADDQPLGPGVCGACRLVCARCQPSYILLKLPDAPSRRRVHGEVIEQPSC